MPPPHTASDPKAADPARADTATRVLDAAEALIIEHGFAATSVRAIAARAGVNLGAAHYHFGSKEGLLGAVIHRRVEPINVARLEALDALEARNPAASTREVLEAFLAPLHDAGMEVVPHLMGRLYGEPPHLSRPLIEREFGETFERFTAALGRALPGVDAAEIRWRFYFAIGATIHHLATDGPPATEPEPQAIERLLAFATAGIEQAAPTPAPPEQTP